jgi:hypothetical protein
MRAEKTVNKLTCDGPSETYEGYPGPSYLRDLMSSGDFARAPRSRMARPSTQALCDALLAGHLWPGVCNAKRLVGDGDK